MATRIALHHQTRYDYDRPVVLGPHVVRLRPAAHASTPVSGYALHIEPGDHFLHWLQDPYANFLARVIFTGETRRLDVTVDLVAELSPINPFDFFIEPGAEVYPFTYEPWLNEALSPYLQTDSASPRLTDWMTQLPRLPEQTVSLLIEVNRLVSERVAYLVRMDPGVQTPEQTLELGEGSCRDSSWLLVAVLRRMGIAARFVSGYLIQLKSETMADPAAVKRDVAELHAWAEAYIPGAGWIGLDPTSGLLTSEGHIPLAATPEPEAAAPVSGTTAAATSRLSHDMTVKRLPSES